MSILTSRRKVRESFAAAGALALVLSPLAAAAPAAADDTDPEVVLSTDFEDDSWEDHWEKSGLPTLEVVDEGGNKVLRVSNRAQDYDGIQTRTDAVHLEHDVVYTFTAKAKVDEDAGGPVSMRGVRKVWVGPGEDDHDYAWIGNTSVGTEWTEITGTFTLPAGSDATTALVYIGSDPAGGPYSYYLDDIVITKPATGPVVVLSSDFEDGETAPWEPRSDGNAPVAIAIHEGGYESDKSLVVTGRAANWHGVQTPIIGLLEPGKTYQVSARVKLAEGEDPQNVKVTVQEERAGGQNWEQVTSGEVVVTDSDWVEITGAYTRPEGVTGGVLYFEAAGDTSSFLVDDVVILGPGGETWSPTPDPGFVPGGAVGTSPTPVSAARGSGKVAALTFDDGPNGDTTLELPDVLRDNGVTTVICVIAQNVQAPGGADVLKRIVADGHTLCNHSTSYADMGSWSHAQVEADLKANLKIIREALDDPQAQVPYFRAPNGSWGVSGQVAAALGMQPLGLGNVLADWGEGIADWDNPQPSVEVLEDLLRAAVQPGAVVLVHDGGGDRSNGVTAVANVLPELLADGWTFTLPRGGAPETGYRQVFDFEDGTLQGWTPRAPGEGPATVEATDEAAHAGSYSAVVKDRIHQGQGIGYDVSDVFQPGVTYDITAWIKFAEGHAPGNISLTLESRTGSAEPSYGTVGTFSGMSSTDWVQVTGALSMPQADYAYLYFETEWAQGNPGNTSTFYVDDIVFEARKPGEIQDVTPLKDTVPFPLGVAIDARETLGAPSQLLLKHFDQVSAENHMKVEAWYAGPWNFQPHDQALQIMDFAQENGLKVYGHVLVWHSQTPDWFFQDEEGHLLSSSEEDKATMRERLRTHIFNVAEALASRYGAFGSATNPLVAWDVVNEVVDDGTAYADGLRRSFWYQILGEEFIHLAFRYADEAFNDVYADESAERPVKLFINDYNTEQSGKQGRYFALVNRLLDAEVPIDGVGHQFHVNLAMPTANLEAAIERFEGLGLLQAVTELDVTVLRDTEAQIREQGFYYQRAFDIFRDRADSLFSVTVWGLTDGRSWRSEGRPLLFDDALQAKPAYYGAAGSDELPPAIREATVFRGDVDAKGYPPSHGVWDRLRLHEIGTKGGFQLRWAPDRLIAYVEVQDASKDASDAVTFEYAGGTVTVPRSGTSTVAAAVEERVGGWAAVVELPLSTPVSQGGTAQLDVRVTDNGTTVGWNSPGELGSLSFVEPLSYTQVLQAAQAPVVDGQVDAVWAGAQKVTTATFTEGTSGATAEVRTLWRDNRLYVLAEVTDPEIDLSGSDPWIQDSLEVFLDAGNVKAGGYRYDDTQIRVNADNVRSFGNGDEAFQAARVESATARTAAGYRVELSVDLLEYGGAGTFHGLDFQVNDASGGRRTSVANWADPTGQGWQDTSRWGVGKLVTALEDDGPVAPEEPEEPGQPEQPGQPVQVAPKVTSHPRSVTAKLGSTVTLKAKASGTPKPTVRWQSKPKGSATWKNVKGATSTSLTVKVSKKTDGTSYRAVFTNVAGKAVTKAAKVTAKAVKATVTKHPRSAMNVKAGTKVKLTVKHKGAYPSAKVTWERRKPGAKSWTKVKGAKGGTLVVVASHASHGVKYRAVVSNKAGKVRSKAATITVRAGKPVFVGQPKHASATAGRTVRFTAQVAARPGARLQWYAKAPGATRWTAVKGARSATLKVRATRALHGTRYTLIASNSHGWTASKMVRLTVRR